MITIFYSGFGINYYITVYNSTNLATHYNKFIG